jgi:hypothetical protein
MNFFRRPDYKSDATVFIESLKTQNPELEAKQREGRSLLWEKSIDRQVAQDLRAGRVAQKPYVYQTAPKA